VRWSLSPSILKEKERTNTPHLHHPSPKSIKNTSSSNLHVQQLSLVVINFYSSHYFVTIFWHGLMARAENKGNIIIIIIFKLKCIKLSSWSSCVKKKSNKNFIVICENSMNDDHQLTNCVRDVFLASPLKLECAYIYKCIHIFMCILANLWCFYFR
jgi:hypothetical protein